MKKKKKVGMKKKSIKGAETKKEHVTTEKPHGHQKVKTSRCPCGGNYFSTLG